MTIYNVADISKAAKKRAVKALEKQYKQKYDWSYSSGEIDTAIYIGSNGSHIVTASSVRGYIEF